MALDCQPSSPDEPKGRARKGRKGEEQRVARLVRDGREGGQFQWSLTGSNLPILKVFVDNLLQACSW